MGSKFHNVKNDLLNLEINTIVKNRIGALKMPASRLAIQDICIKYREKIQEIMRSLSRLGVELEIQHEELKGIKSIDSELTALHDILGEIHKITAGMSSSLKTILSQHGTYEFNEKDADRIDNMLSHLRRMENNSAKLQDLKLFANLKSKKESKASLRKKERGDDLIQLRKIWEVGTEDIVMQTVIQLDGDVVSRIVPQYADDTYSGLHQFHSLGVNTALKYWGNLLDLAVRFFKTTFESIVGIVKKQ